MSIQTIIIFVVELIIGLIIAATVRREERKLDGQRNDSSYEVRQPKYMFWAGVVLGVLSALPVIFVPGTGNETFTPQVAAIFVIFSALGALLAVHSYQWRIIVQYDRLIVRVPFKAMQEMNIEDITAKQKSSGIVLYFGAKKIIAVNEQVIGYTKFRTRFYEAGKIV